MGIASDLDYQIAPQTILQRTVNRIAGTWPIPRLIAPILPRIDRLISGRTDGKGSITSSGGQQVLWVNVRGRDTGELREVPLLAFPFREDLAVIASNFGRPRNPAWVYNLRANPEVELRVGQKTTNSLAREATTDEAEEVWAEATKLLPPYAGYRRRVTERTIPVFIFENRPGPDAA